MLVGCRMEYQIRAVLAQHEVQSRRIAHRTDQNFQIQFRMAAEQLHLNIIGVIFVDIEDNQLLGVGFGNLAAKFAANRAAATGDHDHLTGNIMENFIQVDGYRLSAQQVNGVYFPQLGNAHFFIDHLVKARQCLHLAAGGNADIQNCLLLRRRAGGNGHDDLIDLILFHCRGNIMTIAHNGNAADNLTPLDGIVINTADDAAADVVAHLEFRNQHSTRFAGTDEHYVLLGLVIAHVRKKN